MLGTFKDEYWIVGAVVTTIFETAWALRGYENLLMDFVSNPDRADAILESLFAITESRRAPCSDGRGYDLDRRRRRRAERDAHRT